MDAFSHLLLGYLLGFGVWGPSGIQYVVAAAVAGALPDADVVLFPLSRRFPLLRHRGISHSVVGVTIIAGVGSLIVPVAMGRLLGPGFATGSIWLFFVAMEVGGLSHILLDSMDHWSVPIFAPFTDREYRFDADRIVNVGSMAFTVVAYAVLLEERGHTPIWLWALTTWILLIVALGYILTRLLARWRAGTAQRRAGYRAVIPQANPFVFLFVGDERSSSVRRLRVATYHLGRGILSEPASVEVGRVPPTPDVVRTASEALARSYEPSVRASWWLGETYHFAKVRAAPGYFEVFWYSLEVNFWGRAAGVLAKVDVTDGTVTTRNAWRNPSRVFS